jgi:hypothetical protein
MWSAAVLAPALPARSTPASASLVLSNHTRIGWNPKPPLKFGAADSFSEWHSMRVASTSSTRPGQDLPPAVEAGMSRPASARSSQARSRAAARASRRPASAVSSTASKTRHAVAVEATVPNTSG